MYLDQSGAADLGKNLSDIQSTLIDALAKAGSKTLDIECYRVVSARNEVARTPHARPGPPKRIFTCTL